MPIRDEMETWDATTALMVIFLIITGITALVMPLGAWTHHVLSGYAVESYNPVHLVIAQFTARNPPPVAYYAFVWLLAFILLGLCVFAGVKGRARSRTRGDKAGTRLGRARDIAALTVREATQKADRLGVTVGREGLPVGRTVQGNIPLVSDVESVSMVIAGPRTGKTTAWVVPRIFAAQGAVVATSNKRDIVDSTRARRSKNGQAVWVFDPQAIADEPQTWYWDPLTYVTGPVTAQALVEIFVDSTRDANATTNAYFDGAAKDLCAALILAAASERLPLVTIHRWLNAPTDQEPVRYLRSAGYEMFAQSLMGTMNLVPETRSGVYGSAAQMMSFLLNDSMMKWATPNPQLPAFHPELFVQSQETLYCLSQEGRGTAAPIVTALTVAVTEAALEHAKGQPGGRLAQPMLICLDEAANVCRWGELPDLYSHFGSRGILVDTILQSWSQGCDAWGESGMKKTLVCVKRENLRWWRIRTRFSFHRVRPDRQLLR